jgi:hypothetical protein
MSIDNSSPEIKKSSQLEQLGGLIQVFPWAAGPNLVQSTQNSVEVYQPERSNKL